MISIGLCRIHILSNIFHFISHIFWPSFRITIIIHNFRVGVSQIGLNCIFTQSWICILRIMRSRNSFHQNFISFISGCHKNVLHLIIFIPTVHLSSAFDRRHNSGRCTLSKQSSIINSACRESTMNRTYNFIDYTWSYWFSLVCLKSVSYLWYSTIIWTGQCLFWRGWLGRFSHMFFFISLINTHSITYNKSKNQWSCYY